MVRKLIFTSIAFSYAFFAIECVSVADVVAQFKQARIDIKNGQYEQAEQIYWQIATDNPGTDDALKAQKNLVCLYIADDNQPWAQAALEQLLADFATHERLPHTIHAIAEESSELGKASTARQLYQSVLASDPASDQAIWLQMGIGISNAYLGNDTGADAAIQELITRFSADSRVLEAVGQIAWSYRKQQEHEIARVLYQYIIDIWPDGERAIYSQRGIVLTSIALGEFSRAEAATEKLLTQFSYHKDIAKLVSGIAKIYRGLEDYEKARELHQHVADNWPGSEEAILSQREAILISIALGDDAGIEAGTDKLLTKFSSHTDIVKVVYRVAHELNKKKDPKAGELYQYIVSNHPDDELAVLAQAKIGNIKLWAGDDRTARAIFDQVLTDFAGHPILPQAVLIMADGYWERALLRERQGRYEQANTDYQKTIDQCESIVRQFTENPNISAEACYFSGASYAQMGDYQTAIEYYQMVVDNFPDFGLAWSAQFLIGHITKSLRNEGIIPKSEADVTIRAAYERVLQNYPDSPAAAAARDWLDHNPKPKEGE